jgi:hypothetical protein
VTIDTAAANYDSVKPGDMVLPTNGAFNNQKSFDPKAKLASLEFAVGENGVITAGGVDFVVKNKDVGCAAVGLAAGSKVI